MKTVPLEELSLATFAPLLHTKFRVAVGTGNIEDFELAEAVSIRDASSSRRAGPGMAQETFSLVFHGPGTVVLPQNIYDFEHDGIGRFSLFIVPIGRTPSAVQYQAVFNRLVAPK